MTKIERTEDQNWVEIEGVQDVFRIALCFDDHVAVIVSEETDLPQFPADTKRLTDVDQDGDLLVRVEADKIAAFLTDREIEECEEETEAAA